MSIDLAGATLGTGNDQVNIAGTATLAGTLNLNLPAPATASVGQNFIVATYASRSGTFGFVAPPSLPQNVAFQVDYASSPNLLMVRMVAPQVQQNWTGTSGDFGAAGNWDSNSAPGTASVLSINNSSAGTNVISVSNPTTVHRVTLLGSGAPLTLQVPVGSKLGVANQLTIGANSALAAAGQVYGNIVVSNGGQMVLTGAALTGNITNQSGGIVQLFGAQPASLTGNLANSGQLNLGGGASLLLNGALSGNGSINLGPSARLQIATGSSPSVASSLTLASGATCDLGNSALTINYGNQSDPIATIRTALASGYSNGAWTGVGIASSAASPLTGLGYADGADQAVAGLASNAIMVRYTLYGDVNLDGTVNFNDFAILAAHFNQTNASWDQGDMNYDGKVDNQDFQMLAGSYHQSLGAAITALPASEQEALRGALTSVPEPSALALLTSSVLVGMRRRRRA
jgi:hypothetical protein